MTITTGEEDANNGNIQTTMDVPMGEEKQLHSGKRYETYALNVDKDQDDRATELKICTFQRPHMRAFHYSWTSFFTAFFIWFSIAPLLTEVRVSLNLTPQDIWTTNIVAVTFDIFMRFVLGAVCDKYGARRPMGVVLILASIPTAFTGCVTSLAGLCMVRLFIGLAGSTFVMCQVWSSRMFAKELVGVANGIVGGWGNVGGGATQIVMGTLLFPLFKWFFRDNEDPANMAWRTVCIVPAVFAFGWGVLVLNTSDDCPRGDFAELKKRGLMAEVSAAASFRQGALNLNSWLLYLQYACCFGVELTMNNAAASYFIDKFGMSVESASAIASIFGFMNIFARGVGGWMSDKLMSSRGMQGRIFVQFMLLLLEGLCILAFAMCESIWSAVLLLTIFSIFVQGAEGSTYGIVPYVNPVATGAVSGLVGAGGPTGAVLFGLVFRQTANQKHAYFIMGGCVIFGALLSLVLNLKGYGTLIFGGDDDPSNAVKLPDTGIIVPEKMDSSDDDEDEDEAKKK